jgi:hypothetical protein
MPVHFGRPLPLSMNTFASVVPVGEWPLQATTIATANASAT